MAQPTSDHCRWLTPPQLAKQLRISTSKVLTWIQNGELRAVNVAERLHGRPRWRISPDALEQFLRRRESSPPPPPRRFVRYVPDGRGKVVREDDGRLGQNIPHEERVKRRAKLMAARKGLHEEWRTFVDMAVTRYAEKACVRVDRDAVLALEPPDDNTDQPVT